MKPKAGLLLLILFSAAMLILGGSAPFSAGPPAPAPAANAVINAVSNAAFDAAANAGVDALANAEIKTAGISGRVVLPCQWTGDAASLPVIGTWVNKDYDNDGRSGRVDYIANSDGTIGYSAYDKSDGSGDVYTGTVAYLERWTDDQGRQCGRCKVTLDFGMSWETLDRVSKDGKTLEVQSGVKTINPKGPRYSVYYRK
jgi:hypothetical protein